jgi:hypothetical protein
MSIANLLPSVNRLAAETKSEEHQKILREMARAWSQLAEEVETKS